MDKFLASNSDFVRSENDKIKCVSTGHEMPNKLEIVQQYANGKKYKMAKTCYTQDFRKYEPHIVPSRRSDKELYCTLTKKNLNKIPEEVQRHVEGKTYKRLLAAYMEQQERRAKRKVKEGEVVGTAEMAGSDDDGDDSAEGDVDSGDDGGDLSDESAQADEDMPYVRGKLAVTKFYGQQGAGSGEEEEEEAGEGDDDFEVVPVAEEDDSEEEEEEEEPADRKQAKRKRADSNPKKPKTPSPKKRAPEPAPKKSKDAKANKSQLEGKKKGKK